MHGFGPIEREINEPVFHSEWEARLFATRLALVRAGHWNVDEFRRAIEQMPPASYLAATYDERWLVVNDPGYYELWLNALESVLSAQLTVSKPEIDHRADTIAAHPPSPTKA